jgi:predicted nuclease with TOPRIM domain
MIFPDLASPPKLFPNLSSSPRLFSNLIDSDYYTSTCLMAKGKKVHDSPTPSSNEYDSCDENMEEIEESMIRKFGKKAYTKIKTLVKKLEKRDRCLEMQRDIMTQERDKNLALEASIAEERMKLEKLTVELSLANETIGRLTKERSSVNDQIASLKNEKSIAQECLTSTEEK